MPAPNPPTDALPPTLFAFIRRHSMAQQVIVTLITLVSFPFLYYSFELPKQIINQAIGGKDFPKAILGIELDQIPFLLTLSGIFLALVLINGGFKYLINVYKGRLGERMLRRLRYDLYTRMLRFPLGHFSRNAPGQYIPIITSEVEPLGGFIGDSISLPVFQGGTLLTILVFMFLQDPVLGAAAIALYPLQIWLIPKLQAKVNRMAKQRVRLVRQLSDRINETAIGLSEIHASGILRQQRADFSLRLMQNYEIRFKIFIWKFLVKFLNNFIAQLTPFFFYAIGGYLVIQGNLSFGALVAVLAAYKDLASPWRELLDYYQQLQDNKIKYQQVIEQFEPPGLLPIERAEGDVPPAPLGHADLAAQGVVIADDSGARLLDGVSLSLTSGQSLALVGPDGGGKRDLARALAGLDQPTAGKVTLDTRDLATLSRPAIARRIAYVGSDPVLFHGTVFDNLVLGLRHAPATPAPALFAAEAARTGNSSDDALADWVDRAAAGAPDPAAFTRRLREVLDCVSLFDELRELSLRSTIDPDRHPGLAAVVLECRVALRAGLKADVVKGFYEPFDAEQFTDQASIAENLLFGTPVGPAFDLSDLARNTHVQSVLTKAGLIDRLTDLGVQAARTLSEIFRGLAPDHEIIRTYSFVDADELAALEPVQQRHQRGGIEALKADERIAFASLALRMVPARHRLGLVDGDLRQAIVAARRIIADTMPASLQSQIEFYDFARYNRAISVRDNMLFGRLVPGQETAGSRMRTMIVDVLAAAGLRDRLLEAVTEVGLEIDVGVGGSRLSAPIRQRVAIARALLRCPDVLILNDAAAQLDPGDQPRLIADVLAAMAGRPVVWVLQRATLARAFGDVLLVDRGRIQARGPYDDLAATDTSFAKLIATD